MLSRTILNLILQMRLEGKNSTEIATALGISVNTVKSHIRRHPEAANAALCLNCGAAVPQTPGRKVKKFCSDKCRMTWWNHTYRHGEN